jgi:hypothetical protein
MHGPYLRTAGVVLGLAVLATGCATARAETVPDGPPLTVPNPPTRVFAPLTEPPLVAEPAVAETPTAEAPSVASPPPARRPAPQRAQTPEPTPEPSPASTEVPRELRAASTPADADAERAIRTTLDSARRDLAQIVPTRLTMPGREQYNQAVNFAEQADKALTERNYPFARTLAEKSAEVAAALRNR